MALSPHASADRAIVTAITTGDRAAFDALYLQWFQPLWLFAQRYVGPSLAEDVVQDVFLAIWRQRVEWRIHTTLRAYLFGAVRNRALHHLAHQGVADRSVLPITEEALNRVAGNPLELIAEREAESALVRAIATLPERQRAAIVLRLQRDLSYAEIGEILGISATAAGNLVTKATTKLQSLLERLNG